VIVISSEGLGKICILTLMDEQILEYKENVFLRKASLFTCKRNLEKKKIYSIHRLVCSVAKTCNVATFWHPLLGRF